jgi:hypothetical protein
MMSKPCGCEGIEMCVACGHDGPLPEIAPTFTFLEWIAFTTAQGVHPCEQKTLWSYVNPDIDYHAIAAARCQAMGMHDEHGPGFVPACWDATPEPNDDEP